MSKFHYRSFHYIYKYNVDRYKNLKEEKNTKSYFSFYNNRKINSAVNRVTYHKMHTVEWVILIF